MTYQEYIKDLFIEHHTCTGMDIEEASDLFEESNFASVEKWLLKRGYDLQEMYENDCS